MRGSFIALNQLLNPETIIRQPNSRPVEENFNEHEIDEPESNFNISITLNNLFCDSNA